MTLLSSNLLPKLIDTWITKFLFSVKDHAVVSCKLSFKYSEQGPGLFRAMPTIQKIKEYQDIIHQKIKETLIKNSKLSETKKRVEIWKITQNQIYKNTFISKIQPNHTPQQEATQMHATHHY